MAYIILNGESDWVLEPWLKLPDNNSITCMLFNSSRKILIPFSKFTSGHEVFVVADFCRVYFYLLVILCGEYWTVLEYRPVLNHLIFA